MMPRSSSVESGSFNYGRPSSDPSISMMETIHGGNRDELTLRLDLISLFHASLTFIVLLFPSCQKEQENHKIGTQMSRIGNQKVIETQKIAFQSRFLEIRLKNFLTRYARQKNILAFISRKLDQKYTISFQVFQKN